MSFDDAKANFFAAARHGLNAQFNWVDGKTHAASTLILDHLLPLAYQGLKQVDVNSAEIDSLPGCYRGSRPQRSNRGAMDDEVSRRNE